MSMVQNAHFLPLNKVHDQTPFADEMVQPSLSKAAIDWLMPVNVVGTFGARAGLGSSCWLKNVSPESFGIGVVCWAEAGDAA